jgi:subfamily B ATP-binding cassette protein MsbA
MDVRGVTFKSLRANIGIVTQETILFNDTIRANIAYGMPEATDAEVEDAARKAHIHEVVMKLEQGYSSVIGDRGMRLSGGERQRIAIARALLRDAPILILDEATSQLDTQSERLVQDAIGSLIKGRTVLVIAHRLSTIKDADRIVVLRAGEIAEEGTHDQLLQRDGLYKKLYQYQEIRG